MLVAGLEGHIPRVGVFPVALQTRDRLGEAVVLRGDAAVNGDICVTDVRSIPEVAVACAGAGVRAGR